MKLQVSVAQPPLAGYVNIDASKQAVDLGNLEDFCEQSECTHIVINDVLKFMAYEKLPFVIQHLASRLRHRGSIVLIFTDMNSIIREYNCGRMDEKVFNQLMFQQGSHSCFSVSYIERIIKAVRLTVKEVTISQEQVVIVAERP